MGNIATKQKITFQYVISIMVLMSLLLICIRISADENQRIGRYVLTKVGPNASQMQPLTAVKKLMFPSHIQNVYQAIQHLFKKTGYTLDITEEDQKLLNALSLPNIHRELGPITIISALHTLIGPVWSVNINDRSRKIILSDNSVQDTKQQLAYQTMDNAYNANTYNFQQLIIAHYPEITLKKLIRKIIPQDWKVSYEIPHHQIMQIITFHAESTQQKALEQLFSYLKLEGVFYPSQRILLVKDAKH